MIFTGKTKAEIDSESLTAYKESAKKKVHEYYMEKEEVGVLYNGKHIETNDGSKAVLIATLLNVDNMAFPMVWRTYENFDLVLNSKAEFLAMYQSVFTSLQAMVYQRFSDKDEVDNATSIDQVDIVLNRLGLN